jgi:GH24 family phage-related lysozyme (muramidase)
MAVIPSGQKFHTVASNVQTAERGSALANSQREIFTMQDIIDTVDGGGGVSTIGIGTTGTNVTGTTANTITQSILIPANTLSANNTLELIARFSKTGNAGSGTYRLYFNTSNSLTGATLIASFYTIGTGATIPTHQNTRSFFYNGTNLSNNMAASTSAVSDMIQQTISGLSVAYTSSSDYYLIFAIQLSSTSDSSIMDGYRILKYA